MSTLSDDDRWKQWAERYEVAWNDVTTLMHHRYMWKSIIAMLNSNDAIEHHSLVNGWLVRGYSQTLAVGVRRQCEFAGRRPTVGSILREMEAHPTVPSLQRYIGLVKPDQIARDWPERWHAIWCSSLRTRVSRDRNLLISAEAPARAWVNAQVAHLDKDHITAPVSVTFADLDEALDTLMALLVDYYPLFHPAQVAGNYTPNVSYTWLNMFKTAWLPQGFQPPPEDHNDLGVRAIRDLL